MKKNVFLVCFAFLLLSVNVNAQNRQKVQDGTIIQCW